MSLSKKRVLESLALHQESGRLLASATFLDGYWDSEKPGGVDGKAGAWDSEPVRTSVAYDAAHDGDAEVIKAAVGEMVTKAAAEVTTANAAAKAAEAAAETAKTIAVQMTQVATQAVQHLRSLSAASADTVRQALASMESNATRLDSLDAAIETATKAISSPAE